jgi:hypothetical protein
VKNRDLLIIIVLFLIGIVTRLPFLEQMQSHWDGPQYSIGAIRYSLEQHTPAPLGYPLYIGLGRMFYQFIGDPFRSILMISVLTSGIGAVVFYLLGKTLSNNRVGMIAVGLYLSAPTFFFFGITAYPYGMVPVIAAALGLCVFVIASKKTESGLLLSWLFALAIAVRPQEVIPFICFYAYGWWYLRRGEKIQSLVGACLFCALWILPFLAIVGGPEKYFTITRTFLQEGAIQGFSATKIANHILPIIKGFYLTFTISIILLLYYPYIAIRQKAKKLSGNKYLQVFAVWFLPSFLSNVFIRSDHAGYQMIYLSAFIVPIAYAMYSVGKKKNRYIIFVLLCIGFNLWWFFWDRDPMLAKPYIPTSFHYSEIRKNDIRMSEQVGYIAKHFDPKTTIVITQAQSWRPFMYHLPTYKIINLEGIFTRDLHYAQIVHESSGLNFKMYKNPSLSFEIPKGVSTLVFVDKGINFFGLSREVIPFEHSQITALSVKAGDEYKYTYNTFTK